MDSCLAIDQEGKWLAEGAVVHVIAGKHRGKSGRVLRFGDAKFGMLTIEHEEKALLLKKQQVDLWDKRFWSWCPS